MSNLIDGIDADPLPERRYDVKGNEFCFLCGRSLKGKIAYLDITENKLKCVDTSKSNIPTEVIICHIVQCIRKTTLMYNVRLPSKSIKKIDSTIKDILE